MDTALQLRVTAALKDTLSGPLGKIQQSSLASAQGLGQLRGTLKQLQVTQSEVGKFREMSRGLAATKSQVGAAQQKVAALAQQMQSSTAPTQAMTREFNNAVRTAQKLKERHGQQAIALQGLRDKLGQTGISTRNLASHELGLRQKIDQTSQSLEKQTAQLRAAAAQQQRLAAAKDKYQAGRAMVGKLAGTGAAAMAAGGGVLYAGKRMMAPGMDLEFSLSRVQALTGLDKDSEQMRALRKQARDLGASTSFTAGQAADAQGFLGMAGFKPEDILAAMPGMLSLAKAGNVELAATADIASNILTGMNLTADQMGTVGDVMVAAFTASNTSVASLGETMKYAAPVGALLNQDLQTMAAMAAKLGDAGIQGSMAGTSMKTIMSNLSSPTGRTAKALQQLGIQTKDAQGNMRGMPEILEELHKKTSQMGTGERAGFFKDIAGKEAFSALSLLVDQAGSGGLQSFIQMLRESEGAADKTAATMGDNLFGAVNQLKSAWEDLGTEVYEHHAGSLRNLVNGFTEVIGKIKAWAAANPELVSRITAVIGVVAAMVAGFGALAMTLASIMGPFVMMRYGMSLLGIKGGGLLASLLRLKGGFGVVKTAVMVLGRVLMANPIGAAVTAIGILVYVLYEHWEPISAFFKGLWESTTQVFDASVQWLSELLATWNPLSLLGAAWEAVSGFFTGVWESVKMAFGGGLGGIDSLLLNWSPLGLLYQPIAAALSALGVDMPEKFSEFGSNLVQGLINGIKNMAGAVKDSVTNLGSNVMGWFKDKLGIESPSRVFAEFGGFVSEGAALGIRARQPMAVKAAQALAASVAMGGAMVAQAAPALADGLLEPEAVAARFDMRAPMAAGAAGATAPVIVQGDTITININGAGLDETGLQRAIEAALRRTQAEKTARLRSAYMDRN